MKFYLLVAFICVPAFAAQGIKESQQSTSTALSVVTMAAGVVKARMISACVQPQADTECNPETATLVTIGGDVLSALTTSAVKGVAGPIAGGVISAASCLAIRCDTTADKNEACGGTIPAAAFCPVSCLQPLQACCSFPFASCALVSKDSVSGFPGSEVDRQAPSCGIQDPPCAA